MSNDKNYLITKTYFRAIFFTGCSVLGHVNFVEWILATQKTVLSFKGSPKTLSKANCETVSNKTNKIRVHFLDTSNLKGREKKMPNNKVARYFSARFIRK